MMVIIVIIIINYINYYFRRVAFHRAPRRLILYSRIRIRINFNSAGQLIFPLNMHRMNEDICICILLSMTCSRESWLAMRCSRHVNRPLINSNNGRACVCAFR